jgi:hypothetical protein
LDNNNKEQLELFVCLENCKWNGKDGANKISIVWFWSRKNPMFKALKSNELCMDERKSFISFEAIKPFNVSILFHFLNLNPVLCMPVQRFPIILGITYPLSDKFECRFKLRKNSNIMFPLNAMEHGVEFVEPKGFKRQKDK